MVGIPEPEIREWCMMVPFIFKTLVLFVIWLLLSGKFNPLHMGLGLAVSVAVAWLNSAYSTSPWEKVPWIRMIGYWPWLFGRIVQSSWHLTRLILHPSLPIAPQIIRYRTKLQGEVPIVLLGNSITLTPGTITVEVDGQDLVVHAMDEISGQDLISQKFEHKIAQVFRQEDTHQ